MNKIFSVDSLLYSSTKVYQGRNPRSIKNRILYILTSIHSRKIIDDGLSIEEMNILSTIVAENPSYLGFFIWPFINKKYSNLEKFQLIIAHRLSVMKYFPYLILNPYKCITIASLESYFTGLSLKLENAPWFIREGNLNLSLMLTDIRILTISFSFDFRNQPPLAYIGAIQGSANTSQETYRAIADSCYDLRPRDLTFKLFRLFLQAVNIPLLRCVADEDRVIHDAYFGLEKAQDVAMRYDDLWIEQGGVLKADGYYDLQSEISERPISEVPQKKRGRYKKRIEFYKQTLIQIQENLLALASGFEK